MANGNGRNPAPDSEDLTQWLVEAGRRAWYKRAPEGKANTDRPAEAPATKPRILPPLWKPRSGAIRRIALASVFAVSFLQYYYLTVAVEIASLPTLVVFVPIQTHGARGRCRRAR
jgi:hypothetical protein